MKDRGSTFCGAFNCRLFFALVLTSLNFVLLNTEGWTGFDWQGFALVGGWIGGILLGDERGWLW